MESPRPGVAAVPIASQTKLKKKKMESPHPSQETAVNHKSNKYELANRQKLPTVDGKQTPNLQNNIKTYLDIRDRTVGACSKPSNTKVLQTFQLKMLRSITKAPWFVSNQTRHADLGTLFINEVISKQAIKHRDRIVDHDNHLMHELAVQPLANRRLQRHWPEDLI
jgi:hypothetical protein